MTSFLIENATGIFTGLPGAAMRSSGSIRVRDGVIAGIGALQPEPNERRLDARGRRRNADPDLARLHSAPSLVTESLAL